MELSWNESNMEVILTQCVMIETMMKNFLPAEADQEIPGKRSLWRLNPAYYEADENATEQKTYQSLIGGLLFVVRMARPEISVHVNLPVRRAINLSATLGLGTRES